LSSNTSISEAQRRRIIHGVVSELASTDPDSEAYESKLAELESHLAQLADSKPRVNPQPHLGPAGSAAPGAGAALWARSLGKAEGANRTGRWCIVACLASIRFTAQESSRAGLALGHSDQAATAPMGRSPKAVLLTDRLVSTTREGTCCTSPRIEVALRRRCSCSCTAASKALPISRPARA